MNCKQTEELLPLHAGPDLDEKRARLVTAHLQSCAACMRVADEYRDAFQLTRQFAPPAFSGDVYAQVRSNVLREIGAQSASALLPEVFARWLPRRVTWAAAGASAFAFTVFALYFVANWDTATQPFRNNRAVVSRSEPRPPAKAAPPASSVNSGVKPHWQRRRRSEDRASRSSVLAAKGRDLSSRAAETSPNIRESAKGNSFPLDDSFPQGPALRLEIQTKDPNIRIIWFSQPNSKPMLPSSKGI
jgi:hypothetical protein